MTMIDKPPAHQLLDERLPVGLGGRFYGLFPALVSDIKDPDGQGRVKVKLPWAQPGNDADYEAWARLATLMAGNDRGTWFIPDVNDEVLVGFEGGDPRRPYVIGCLWNGSDQPPESMDSSGRNERKLIKSRSGVTITIEDSAGQETLSLETPGGQSVVLKDGGASIEASDSNGNSVKLESSGVTVSSSAKVTVNASAVQISASMVTVDAGMSKFSGVVKADTVITNTVVATTYTPGAGNIW
jgi:uncharacterized protein involved in type VI secretion and phage assembly